jgi:hypothetical protein
MAAQPIRRRRLVPVSFSVDNLSHEFGVVAPSLGARLDARRKAIDPKPDHCAMTARSACASLAVNLRCGARLCRNRVRARFDRRRGRQFFRFLSWCCMRKDREGGFGRPLLSSTGGNCRRLCCSFAIVNNDGLFDFSFACRPKKADVRGRNSPGSYRLCPLHSWRSNSAETDR